MEDASATPMGPTTRTLSDQEDIPIARLQGPQPLDMKSWLETMLEPRKRSRKKKELKFYDVEQLNTSVQKTLNSRWATGSWGIKRTVWNQWLEFKEANWPTLPAVPPEPSTPMQWVASLSIKSKNRYARELRAIMVMMEPTRLASPEWLIYSEYQRALAKEEVLLPDEIQALPLSRDVLNEILATVSPEIGLILWIARKTASRIDEVLNLAGGSILEIDEHEALIWFGYQGRVKTARQLPRAKHQPQLYCHLKTEEEIHFLILLKERAMRVARTENLFATKSEEIEDLLAKVPVDPNWRRRFPENRDHYSLHSLKVGALNDLLEFPQVSDIVLSLMAKHRNAANQLATPTVSYLRRNPKLARRLGTGVASALL